MRVCHRCGTENPARANFCMRCGAALASRVGGEERKVVTVVFCDLVEFTARAERMDPEDVKETLRAYHRAVKELIERHGGTVEKFLGDGVIGVFGMPIAHEDDPERAVRTALRTLEAIEDLNHDRDLDLHARIGVNTGEALVSTVPGEQIGGSVAGDVVNTCARLQAAAPVDGVLVGEATHRATASAFIYEAHAPVVAKGKAAPVIVWRPLRARSRVEESPVEADPPFVGRTAELDVLKDAFRRARDAGGEDQEPAPPVVVLVTGEAGVGKTRLIREFAGYLDELPSLVRWRRGRCLPYGDGVRFWALGEVVKAEAGILDTDDPHETGRKLDAAVIDLGFEPSERAWMRSMLEPLVGLSGPPSAPSRNELFAAWRRFLGAMAEGSAVVVFEDLQWADLAMLEFLGTLHELSGVRLLAICVTRPELEDRFPEWSAGIRNPVDLHVEPLAVESSERLVRSLLGDLRLPEPTVSALLGRAGGNPLFAEEFVRMLRDGGEPGLATSTDIPIPDSLQSLVVARLDTLAPDLKDVVHDASVVGKIFWPGAVAAVGETSPNEVVVRLPFLLRRGLITRRESSIVEGEPEFAFRHDVTLEVAYQQIPKAGRARKHRNAAAWVRMLGGDRVADFAQEIAFHLLRSLELTPTPDPELRQATAHAQLLAAGRLAALDAPAAVRAYRRALALLARDDPARPEAFRRAGTAADAVGRFDLAEPWLRQSIAAFRATGEARQAGETMGLLARSLTIQGRLTEADELFDAAVHELEMLPPGPELAGVCARIAGRAFMAGDYERALRWADRTLEVAIDDEPKEAVVLALQYRGSVRAERGERGGMDDLREAIRRAKEADLAEVLGATLGNLAYLTWFREGPAAALEIAREVQAFAGARGFSVTEMWGRAAELESCFDLGDWDRVLFLADEMLAWDAEHGPSQIGMWARFAIAWVSVRRGETERAADALAELTKGPELLEYPEFQATVTAIAAVVALAQGETATALTKVDEFDKAVADVPEVRVHFLPVLTRVAVACGDLQAAERIVPPDPGPPVERRRLSYDTAVAVLDEARGEPALAEGRYRTVAEGWEAFGFPLETGQCLMGRARCLRRIGRADEATAVLVQAREQLVPLGAVPLLAELDAQRLADEA